MSILLSKILTKEMVLLLNEDNLKLIKAMILSLKPPKLEIALKILSLAEVENSENLKLIND